MARTRFVDLSISIKTGYGHMEKKGQSVCRRTASRLQSLPLSD